MYAYSNNGLSRVGCSDPSTAPAGAVFYDHIPSASELTAAFPNYESALVADLGGRLVVAAGRVCDAVQAQIAPNSSQLAAYLNAAQIVAANGGSAPTGTGIIATAFNAQATSHNMTPAAFATMVEGVQASSLQLSAIQTTVSSEVATASSTSQLASAMSTFETEIGGFVAALNGLGLPVTIVAPDPIVIPGVNA